MSRFKLAKWSHWLVFAVSVSLGNTAVWAMEVGDPVAVLEQYLKASYARDTDQAYQYLSAADKTAKTLDVYRAESGSYSGYTLELARALAMQIELDNLSINIAGNRATVEFSAVLPDANHPSLTDTVMGFNQTLLERLEPAEREARLQHVFDLRKNNELAVVHSPAESWDLVFEKNEWRVFVNWADAIEVLFDSVVSEALGWEFVPAQSRVLAQPGQTVQMSYLARNVGEIETTGKARHTIGAANVAEYLEIVACFCFLEQTLAVGESAELPLVFRVDYDVPDAIRQFIVSYEFFDKTEFPAEGTS